jgi:hypothetical protein
MMLFIGVKTSLAQESYLPYSYQFYQKLNKEAYSAPSNFHSSLKPYVIADSGALQHRYDSLMTPNANDTTKGIIYQLWFERHLLQEKTKDYTIYFDILPDIQGGHEFNEKVLTWINTRGVQLGGTVGKNFFFYSSLYENQARFANYENNYISQLSFVPGQAYDRNLPTSDWAYVTALLGYTVNKNISIQMGEDKTFIGDGYRSVLLSDFAAPYPLLRLNATLFKNVQYTAMWAYLENQKAKQFDPFGNDRRMWGAFHYIDWNISKKASLGFFNALIAEEANDSGIGHGFDFNYINPVYFTSSLQPSSTTSVPDHTLLGLNGKYNVLNKTTIYGQLLIDQTTQVSFGKRNAWQLGLRGSDLFTLPRLNYLFEYNTAKPYTYSNQNAIVSYAQFCEPLAHPYGANFKEFVSLLNYSIKRFDFQFQFDYAKYGLDLKNGNSTLNEGSSIIEANNQNLPTGNINTTGQGLATTLHYAEGVVDYLINPKYNLRLELSGLLRTEKNTQTTTNTSQISFGLRGSFRNLYHDF